MKKQRGIEEIKAAARAFESFRAALLEFIPIMSRSAKLLNEAHASLIAAGMKVFFHKEKPSDNKN